MEKNGKKAEKLYSARELSAFCLQISLLLSAADPLQVRTHGDDDFSFALPGVTRFRANVFRQRSSLVAVIRVVIFFPAGPGRTAYPADGD